MNKIKVIAICGKSAAGKDTLMKEMLKLDPNLHEIVSHTTRPPREGEVDGVNYHFVDIGVFYTTPMLERTEFRKWHYGTALSSLDENVINIGVFNMAGISALRNDARIDPYIIYLSAGGKARLIRALEREDYPDVDEIVRRYLADEQDFYDFNDEDLMILNDLEDNLKTNAKEALELISAHWADQTN